MPRTARMKSKNGVYHVMLRGANKLEIFHDDADNMKFLDILKKYKEESGMRVYAWCLMNNHVHLLVREVNEDLSTTMKRIGVSYVSYYNWKYQTTGHLFQDRFRSESVESRRYFLTVIRYIHQNPVKAGIVSKVSDWRWSSCAAYYGQKSYACELLSSEKVFKMMSDDVSVAREKFREFNEQNSDDECMDVGWRRRRLTDEAAREEINLLLGNVSIAHVKSLPKLERWKVLRKVKLIEGLTQRQAGRILGVSTSLINKVWGEERENRPCVPN
ncbi:REP-associated tyrosine transposase [Heyndrickxia sp. MSNUG]|uniref:REP-associated tyrosine transposase n=1 Tax=Heyndrickxia sp. MSNUG TaxID=3136677 RepID=UPI003C2D27DF